jgi:outer membrane protein assembly factor BamB
MNALRPFSGLSAVTAVGSLLMTFGPARADWPQFRGSDAAGKGDGHPPLSPNTADVAWKEPLPGRGLSSPVVLSGKVFLTAASGPDQQTLHVLCFEEKSGKRLWERRFQATGRTMCHEKTNVAAPTPASDGQRIFALFSSNDLFCLDLDGNLVWLRGFTVDYPNASNSLGLASSPVMADGVLVAQIENDSDSFIAGLDPVTGANLWKIPRPKVANWTTPVVWRDGSGGCAVLVNSVEGVLALDPKTGKERWNLPKPGSSIPSSGISAKHLAVPRPGKGLAVWSLTDAGTAPQMVWESPQINSDTSSPVIHGNRVFSINGAGVLSCAELDSGDRPWKLRLEGPFSGSPVMSGSNLYAVSERGVLQCVDTAAPEGVVAGKLPLDEQILCTPSLSGNAIYVRSDSHVWRVGRD